MTKLKKKYFIAALLVTILVAGCTMTGIPTQDFSAQETLAAAQQTMVALESQAPKEVEVTVQVEVVVTATNPPDTPTPEFTATPSPTATPAVALTSLAETLTAVVVSSTPTDAPTLEADMMTATAEHKPTNTPQPTVVPCNSMTWVYDDTIVDGTYMNPGEFFVKKWRVQNTGTCTWQAGEYSIVYIDGEKMGASERIYLPFSIPPEGYTSLTVNMNAPYLPGEHTGYWKLEDGKDNVFGLGTEDYPLSVVINVRGEVPTTRVADFTPAP